MELSCLDLLLMQKKIKRLFDLVASVLGLLIMSPLMLFIAWRIKEEDNGPIFYRGARVGLHGKPFRIFKYRSMVVDAEKLGPSSTVLNDPRINKIGQWIRTNKLDELPQLLNVLIGDMSFVGPRPQVKWAVDLYTPEERLILSVRPGITDFASIKFSNESELLKYTSDPDKAYMKLIHPHKTQLAIHYIKKQSFLLDVKLIMETVICILKKKRI